MTDLTIPIPLLGIIFAMVAFFYASVGLGGGSVLDTVPAEQTEGAAPEGEAVPAELPASSEETPTEDPATEPPAEAEAAAEEPAAEEAAEEEEEEDKKE